MPLLKAALSLTNRQRGFGRNISSYNPHAPVTSFLYDVEQVTRDDEEFTPTAVHSDGGVAGLHVTDDGNYLYVRSVNGKIYQYSFANPYDLSSVNATHTGVFTTNQTNATFNYGMCGRGDGKELVIGTTVDDRYFYYAMSSTNDMGTMAYVHQSNFTQSPGPGQATFAVNGTRFLIDENNDANSQKIVMFNLSTPYRINTGTLQSSWTISDSTARCGWIHPSGERVYHRSNSPAYWKEYELTTPGDLSSRVFVADSTHNRFGWYQSPNNNNSFVFNCNHGSSNIWRTRFAAA